jgi:hypothetical protein
MKLPGAGWGEEGVDEGVAAVGGRRQGKGSRGAKERGRARRTAQGSAGSAGSAWAGGGGEKSHQLNGIFKGYGPFCRSDNLNCLPSAITRASKRGIINRLANIIRCISDLAPA